MNNLLFACTQHKSKGLDMRYILALTLLLIGSLNAASSSTKPTAIIFHGPSARSTNLVEAFTVIEENNSSKTTCDSTTNCIESANKTLQSTFHDVEIKQITIIHGMAENRAAIQRVIDELFPYVVLEKKTVLIDPRLKRSVQAVITGLGVRKIAAKL